MTEALFVYITVPTAEVARAIALAVLDQRLAACANILPGMTSLYRWEGKTEEAHELVLLLKTCAELFDKIEQVVRGVHPYTCPCIVGLPVSCATKDYLNWINESVSVEG